MFKRYKAALVLIVVAILSVLILYIIVACVIDLIVPVAFFTDEDTEAEARRVGRRGYLTRFIQICPKSLTYCQRLQRIRRSPSCAY